MKSTAFLLWHLHTRRSVVSTGSTSSARAWSQSAEIVCEYRGHPAGACWFRRCKMATINEANVERKFNGVSTTQDSIQSLALWVIHHKASHEKIVEIWFKVLKKCKLIFAAVLSEVFCPPPDRWSEHWWSRMSMFICQMVIFSFAKADNSQSIKEFTNIVIIDHWFKGLKEIKLKINSNFVVVPNDS